MDIGKSIRNRLETLGKSESMLTSNVLLDESEQLIVNNLMNNKITFYLVEEHILGVICHELHCTLADLLNLDSGRISFSESINSDDEKAKQVKIAVDDYINDFEFVTNIK